MKLVIASAVVFALATSPAFAQTTPVATTHVKTTTKTAHIQGTVPKTTHHKRMHHAMRCGCPTHAYKMHHKTVTTKTTTTKS